jgi:hypothetical protein
MSLNRLLLKGLAGRLAWATVLVGLSALTALALNLAPVEVLASPAPALPAPVVNVPAVNVPVVTVPVAFAGDPQLIDPAAPLAPGDLTPSLLLEALSIFGSPYDPASSLCPTTGDPNVDSVLTWLHVMQTFLDPSLLTTVMFPPPVVTPSLTPLQPPAPLLVPMPANSPIPLLPPTGP